MQRIEPESVTAETSIVDVICKTADVLISKCYRARSLDAAAHVATKVVDIKKNYNILALETQRILAEIHLGQKNIEGAETLCREIIAACESNERAQIHEETNLLLVLINYRKGETSEAMCTKELMSEKYKSKKYPR